MNCLVTGGGGFLGLAIVKQLLAQGHHVRTFQRGDYSELTKLNAAQIRGDLLDPNALAEAAHGIDAVFHVAARPGVWGSYKDFHQPNVIGTQNVIDACKRHNVPRLIFTSSPSVVFTGRDDANLSESAPYPKRYLAHYPKTKAIAERLVLTANSPHLAAIALRPHLIWGPGDPHLVPRILSRPRSGRLSMIGKRKISSIPPISTMPPTPTSSPRRNFPPTPPAPAKLISSATANPSPWRISFAASSPPQASIPSSPTSPPHLAYAAGAAMELSHKLLRLKSEPLLTRFVARQLSTAHWFDITAAKRDLGYSPLVSLDEGMRRLSVSLRSSSAEVHA